MLDHVSLIVSDFAVSRDFYLAALAPLGYEIVLEIGQGAGLGVAGKPDFWIHQGDPTTPIHLAFRCAERGPVDAFHAAALSAGAEDHGAPGLRPHYHPNYYGAFVIDPDGHNLEAVCHGPA